MMYIYTLIYICSEYKHVYIYKYILTYTYVYTYCPRFIHYIYRYKNVYIYKYMYTYISITFVHIYTNLYIYVYTGQQRFISLVQHICIHTHIYMYLSVFICTFIPICKRIYRSTKNHVSSCISVYAHCSSPHHYIQSCTPYSPENDIRTPLDDHRDERTFSNNPFDPQRR
jgi:hypothetical protein